MLHACSGRVSTLTCRDSCTTRQRSAAEQLKAAERICHSITASRLRMLRACAASSRQLLLHAFPARASAAGARQRTMAGCTSGESIVSVTEVHATRWLRCACSLPCQRLRSVSHVARVQAEQHQVPGCHAARARACCRCGARVATRPDVAAPQLWDSCERTTRKPEASADGACLRAALQTAQAPERCARTRTAVVCFAVLRRAGDAPHTLLVKQFRPPVRAFWRSAAASRRRQRRR